MAKTNNGKCRLLNYHEALRVVKGQHGGKPRPYGEKLGTVVPAADRVVAFVGVPLGPPLPGRRVNPWRNPSLNLRYVIVTHESLFAFASLYTWPHLGNPWRSGQGRAQGRAQGFPSAYSYVLTLGTSWSTSTERQSTPWGPRVNPRVFKGLALGPAVKYVILKTLGKPWRV